jgi:hypothetical protein
MALTLGKVVKTPTITWKLWEDYVIFFQAAVAAAGFANDAEERSSVDRALFVWGKSLKITTESELDIVDPPEPPIKITDGPTLWGHPVPHTRIVPPNTNVLRALKNFLNSGDFSSLRSDEQQNLRDLQLHEKEQSYLHHYCPVKN